MQLHVIDTGYFKLDGGAMFGVVPKSIWQKTNPADQQNLCTWAMRCLLIEHDTQLILIDCGIGSKQDQKFLGHYHLHGDETLETSLRSAGFSFNDITDVFLTHLHFDHCGGALLKNKDGQIEPTFPRATYWSNRKHWDWAVDPNPREKASFLKDNILPLADMGHLSYITEDTPFPGMTCLTVSGHTESMMIPKISYKGKIICYMADLLPSVGHIPLPYIMAYDTRPLLTLSEKEAFLQEAADHEYILFFEHDPQYECCTVHHTEKGVRLKETFRLADIL